MSHPARSYTAEYLLDTLASLPRASAYLVGFSGGADSTALLHALCAIRPELGIPIAAVHINHQIHDDADTWQTHCEIFCKQLKVDLTCVKIKLKKDSGKGLEAQARTQRYEALSSLLKPGQALLTAHHADDQTETLLLNLMRGSGVDGLSAMPAYRILGAGLLLRPLLGVGNKALKTYLLENGSRWLEDPSNQQLDHDRNFVRHQLLPAMETRWPGVGKRLLLTRNAMSETRIVLESVAQKCLATALLNEFVLNLEGDLIRRPEHFKLVVRQWLRQTGQAPVPARTLESLCQQLANAKKGQKIVARWADVALRLYRTELWLQPAAGLSPCPTVRWPAKSNTVKLGNDCGHLVFEGSENTGHKGQLLVANRSNSHAESIKQGPHHRSLKNLFQSSGIPPWLRNCIPLCELNGDLVAVGDWCLDQQFSCWLTNNDITLKWYPEDPGLQFIQMRLHAQLANERD